MSRPRIAIATCARYEELKADDGLLRGALEGRGIEAVPVIWDADEVAWEEFAACLIRSTWDYHDKHPRFLGWVEAVGAATELWNPAQLVAWNADKSYLRQLAEAGVRTVPTVWVERDGEARLDDLLAQRGWPEAVVKPTVDLGAMNLRRVRAGSPAGQEALAAILREHEAMVQPYLPSLEKDGELSLIYIAGELTHAVRKRPAPGDFRVQSIWGGIFVREEPRRDHVELARQTLEAAFSLTGIEPLYARVDLVDDLNGQPCLIELELIEPNLYLGESEGAAATLADAILAGLDS
jgi:hypothetical protein